MQENKEFEDKMLFEKWYGDFQKQQGERRITVKDMFEAYKAALQSERDKRRWISVTERLPTEKDKRENTELFGVDEEKDGCVYVPCYVKIFDGNNRIFYNDVLNFCTTNHCFYDYLGYDIGQYGCKAVSWQPLPEA